MKSITYPEIGKFIKNTIRTGLTTLTLLLIIQPITQAITVSKPLDWRAGQIKTTDGRHFVWSVNWGTLEPNSYSHFLNGDSTNNWGGSWNWGSGRSGGYAAQITHGIYELNGDKTINEAFPYQISSLGWLESKFKFTPGTMSGHYNAYWELWVNSTSSVGSGIGKSVFIKPYYSESSAKEPGDFEFTHRGVKWYGHVWAGIVEFKRSVKTTNPEVIDIGAFLKEAANRDPAISSNYWVLGINAGFESFNGSGSFTCTQFYLNGPSSSTTSTGFSGDYEIKNKWTGRLITNKDASGSGANGATLTQQNDGGNWQSQKYRLVSVGSGYHEIVNRWTNRLITNKDASGSGANQKELTGQTDGGSFNSQRWKVINVGGGYYKIKNKWTNRLITAKDTTGSGDNMKALTGQNDGGNWGSQRWKFTRAN